MAAIKADKSAVVATERTAIAVLILDPYGSPSLVVLMPSFLWFFAFASVENAVATSLKKPYAMPNQTFNNSRATLSHEQTTVPCSEEYVTKLLSGNAKRNGSITLVFSRQELRRIDNDGWTIITEGHANYDGMAWLEG